MLSEKLQAALNEQVTAELFASHLYLSMAAHFSDADLPGFEAWMRAQAEEERGHAFRLFDFVLDRDGQVTLGAIDAPATDFGSALATMEAALGHEQKVSAQINALYKLAGDESDYPAQVMLQWFVTEQVEEEKTAMDIIARLKLAGDDGAALLLMDQEMGSRPTGGE
jgi:ferritin